MAEQWRDFRYFECLGNFGESLGVGMFIFVMEEGLRIVNILILSGRAILWVSIFHRREGLRVGTLRVRWCLPGN